MVDRQERYLLAKDDNDEECENKSHYSGEGGNDGGGECLAKLYV